MTKDIFWDIMYVLAFVFASLFIMIRLIREKIKRQEECLRSQGLSEKEIKLLRKAIFNDPS